ISHASRFFILLPVLVPATLTSLFASIALFPWPPIHRALHSFPTRRSSDIGEQPHPSRSRTMSAIRSAIAVGLPSSISAIAERIADRKSTRLNSSHQIISYAVCCLKKKNAATDFDEAFALEKVHDEADDVCD